MKNFSVRSSLPVALLLIALWQGGSAAYIHVKAGLAQVLIEDAWERSLQLGSLGQKPWAWADTWPLGRLQVSHGSELLHDYYVLAGSAGNSLAFGPAHVTATAQPGHVGSIMIGGHRDTHFRKLKSLVPGDRIRLQSVNGVWRDYSFVRGEVVDTALDQFLIDVQSDQLLLVTCYPFDSIQTNGSQRWVGVAR